jgi:hypothetical protein
VKTDISESTDKDITVFWGGANDASNNNAQEGLKYIVNVVQTIPKYQYQHYFSECSTPI